MSIHQWMRDTFGDPREYAAKVLEQLSLLGAEFMWATYEGGNDEGGVTGIVLYRSVVQDNLSEPGGIDEIQLPTPLTWESALWRATDELLSTEFGTWAGDYSAEGCVYAIASQKRVWSDGTEMVRSDDGRGFEVDFNEEGEN